MIISVPSLFTNFMPIFPISSRINLVAGSISDGILYVQVIMAHARDLLDRYRRRLPRRVIMIGALWAREYCISLSCWMALLTSSCISYSWVLPLMTRWTLRMLGLCKSLTVHLMRYRILLLSSLFIVCLMAAMHFFVSSPLSPLSNLWDGFSLVVLLASLGLPFWSLLQAVL